MSPGVSSWQRCDALTLLVARRLADFEGPGELDPAHLKSLAIADVTAATGGAPGRNTIWIGKVGME
ncbi:hypothetical protein SBA4_7670002 [Candidatus Sulfopaludibacter sp. SbA4]|nr:hypothetical protein SBA4_7670002 [Candidatus Sulfopaludibacter sp. SbA4]